MSVFFRTLNTFVLLTAMLTSANALAQHPNLVLTVNDVKQMRAAIGTIDNFTDEYEKQKARIELVLSQIVDIPMPKDGGGGYTHEQHKSNYMLMFDAAVIYQLSQDKKYADFVRDMFLRYADLYPKLPLHPMRKVNAQNPGKFFWQSLNEAVWLVYSIQAYDLIYDTLSEKQINKIEQQLLKPVAEFLSEGQPSTFNKVHNHGTWATAGVGMAGYVMNEPEWVEKALYDLEKSGKGGFVKQLDELFSPQGYYNEGPYYQRYALMPFVTFAKAIENNEPQRKIFEYRDGILLKAITTTIELSYNGLFFPINDAIKSKGIDTVELVQGVTVAYGITDDTGLLDIARQQNQILLTGDGLAVAKGLESGAYQPYQFASRIFGDGKDGNDGALVVMRSNSYRDQAVLFKPTSQGLGHGHFDKLTWQFYDGGAEIVSDYGAARFLNVEAKYGGRYLPENNSYAKQTVAHNTLVVNEKSHFNSDVKVGNQHAPHVGFFEVNKHGTVASASIDTAYSGVVLERTMALLQLPNLTQTLVLDIFDVTSDKAATFDLPLHYHGQIIETNFPVNANTNQLSSLGKDNGYQHLWLKGTGKPDKGLARVTWLNDNGHFYSQTNLSSGAEEYLFTQTGANDPQFNLRNENGFIRRIENERSYQFISLLEPHGEYNPNKEYTRGGVSRVTDLSTTKDKDLSLIKINIAKQNYLVVINHAQGDRLIEEFTYNNKNLTLDGRLTIHMLTL